MFASTSGNSLSETLSCPACGGCRARLIDIYRYIVLHDCVENADHVLDQLESLCSRLTDLPERGHIPPELDRIGVTSYREVNFKPYRVIYEVIQQDVFVHCILDGRRDIPSLLERRLIR